MRLFACISYLPTINPAPRTGGATGPSGVAGAIGSAVANRMIAARIAVRRGLQRRVLAVLTAVLCLGACGNTERSAPTAASPEPSASSGQVAPAAAASPFGITTYAASRFLDQATFGPTASSIAELKRLGFEGWIAAQQALPVPAIDGSILEGRDPGPPDPLAVEFAPARFTRIAISDPAQLRVRAAWSLSQFLVVSQNKVVAFAVVQYANFLMANAFTNYTDFLRALTLHASMGNFLDNSENRAASACIGCSPNENYARELLQLFTIGVHKLNIDGSIVRDVRGRPVETYSESDVQALARALTGWTFQSAQPGLGKGNWANFGKPMIALRPNDHDKDAKRLLGTDMSPNQNAASDLDAAIAIIMAHPNVAPFVSLRLIQHLVASDPSPDYIRRVATVFNNDGAGKKGNLAAVVKAVLLDPEARRGDNPASANVRQGYVREPFLAFTARWRGMGCRESPVPPQGIYPGLSWNQKPFQAPSVFSFYLPTDRAPGSLLLAPEQGLLNGGELSTRIGDLAYYVDQGSAKLTEAGCRFEEFEQALVASPETFLDLASLRYFRGSLPPALRVLALELLAQSAPLAPRVRAASVLAFLLSSPYFGAIK